MSPWVYAAKCGGLRLSGSPSNVLSIPVGVGKDGWQGRLLTARWQKMQQGRLAAWCVASKRHGCVSAESCEIN